VFHELFKISDREILGKTIFLSVHIPHAYRFEADKIYHHICRSTERIQYDAIRQRTVGFLIHVGLEASPFQILNTKFYLLKYRFECVAGSIDFQ